MKPDSMLVEPTFLQDAMNQIAAEGLPRALKRLRQQEPILAAFLFDRLAALSGELALGGAPPQVVRGNHAAALSLVLVLEGLLWAISPNGMKRAAALALALADEQLRMGGVIAVALGVSVLWLLRG